MTLLATQVLMIALLSATWLHAQAAPQSQVVSATDATPTATTQEVADPGTAKVPNYRYEAKGRRDPFRTLDVSNEAKATTAPLVRPRGLKGQLVSEMNIVGVVTAKGERLAVATGYGGKTFFLRPADDLLDGKVLEIRKDSVTFSQMLTDSFGKKISQQVVKRLHPTRGEGTNEK